jgi:uncharacterized membrane protein YozB (DUF420 family)
MATPATAARQVSDRAVFLPAALIVSVLVFIGFGPSYYYRPFIAPADSLTVLVHVHGALMTAWFVLFAAQVGLVAAGRRDLHRRIGVVGFFLLPLIFVVLIWTSIVAARLGGNHMPGPPIPALALVFALLVEFVAFAGLGLVYRRQVGMHKRLMLLAAICAMDAGVSRLPLDFLSSLARVHWASNTLLLLFIIFDTIRHRRLHPTFLWGFATIVSVQQISTWVSGTNFWLRIGQAIVAQTP